LATNILGHVDRRRYNPSRDIAYCWPSIMQSAMDRVSKGTGLPWFMSLVKKHQVTDEALSKTAKAIAHYMAACNKPDECPSNVKDAMEKSGLFECDETAKMLLYAALGETMMAAFYSSIRDVLVEDEPSPLNDKRLIELVGSSMDRIFYSRRSALGRVCDKVVSFFKK
jgi:hypothetical protein